MIGSGLQPVDGTAGGAVYPSLYRSGLCVQPISRICSVYAIHGLLITAWSAAGVFGPVLVNYIREYQIIHGVPKTQAYNATMYIMAGRHRLHLQLHDKGRPRTSLYEAGSVGRSGSGVRR
jgi:hypothetical protein